MFFKKGFSFTFPFCKKRIVQKLKWQNVFASSDFAKFLSFCLILVVIQPSPRVKYILKLVSVENVHAIIFVGLFFYSALFRKCISKPLMKSFQFWNWWRRVWGYAFERFASICSIYFCTLGVFWLNEYKFSRIVFFYSENVHVLLLLNPFEFFCKSNIRKNKSLQMPSMVLNRQGILCLDIPCRELLYLEYK